MFENLQPDWIDAIGFVAGGIMLGGMFRRTMIPVRMSLVGGNLGFIVFGVLTGSFPTVITHVCLLPMNAVRLYQIWNLVRQIREAEESDVDMEILLPFMDQISVKAGDFLFRKGDDADCMYIIHTGSVRLTELDSICGPQSVLGEIAAFTPNGHRTASALAETDCQLHRLNNDKLIQIYYQNPEFGLILVRTMVRRLVDNWQTAEDRARSRAMLT